MSTLQDTHTTEQTHTALDTLRILSLVLVVIGLAISGYLSYVKLSAVPTVCVEGSAFNCGVVQNSAYSKVLDIPIAYLGLATYLVLGGILLLENRLAFLRDFGITLVFAISLSAFVYSMWLVYVQVAILQAVCPWCLAHEVTMTLLFIISALRLRRSMRDA